MNVFSRLVQMVKEVIRRMFPYKDIEAIEHIETPLSQDMVTALDKWYALYVNRAEWLSSDKVKSLNLPAFISSEIARQIVLEMKWNITGKTKDGESQDEDGDDVMNPRAEYLKTEFERCIKVLRQKLEQGCAAGGMTIKPYPKAGHIYFDWTMDWSLYPIAFDDDGNLADVIFKDIYTEGKYTYTRLERHTIQKSNDPKTPDSVKITQRAFKSTMRDSIGVEISLTEVPQWAGLQAEATVKASDGQMFGWYKVAAANNVDVDSPMGASVFNKAIGTIKEADLQFSRMLWEFEGSELAIDVDPTVLRQNKDGKKEMPHLNDRLFRGVDLGTDDNYHVFNPTIRDVSLINGLNQILMRIEDQAGLARGTLSDPNTEARTATELLIVKQRSYATIADNQKALEQCLRDVIRAMDKYADIYNLAPAGDYEVSFEWDDSIITDVNQQMQERLLLLDKNIMSKSEFREWYFGETQAQAKAAIEAVQQEALESIGDLQSLLPKVNDDGTGGTE